MSGGVDVLRVLTQTIADAEVRDRRYAETLREARVAVSELIEADQEYDSAHDHLRSVKRGWKFDPAFATDEEWAPLRSAKKRLEASIARRAAALGRVQANSHGGLGMPREAGRTVRGGPP